MKQAARLSAVLVLILGLGCGRRGEEGREVRLDQVPPAALKAAEAKLPDVSFHSAWKETEGGVETFEIQGQNRRGKYRDIKVDAKGNVLEVD